MPLLDALIDDVSRHYALGPTAAPLVREALALVVGAEGGLRGFLDLFRRAGLGPLADSWLGQTDPAPLAAGELQSALGAPTIDAIAHRLGVALPAASAALSYVLPKLVGLLTPQGVVSAPLPPEATALIGPLAEQPAPASHHAEAGEIKHIRAGAGTPRLLWPLILIAAVVGMGWAVWPILFPEKSPEATTAAPAVAQAPKPPPTVSPTLSIANDNGVAVVSGSVHDDATRRAILDALKASFGADRVKGDVAVDPSRAGAPWLANFPAALEALKIPGVKAAFEGGAVNVGGAIVDADHEKVAASLKLALGNGVTIGAIADAFSGAEASANAKAAAALASLKAGFTGDDLAAVANQAAVDFPYGSAALPAPLLSLIGDLAASVKKLPPGAGLEIAGYTDNTGDPGANVALSQRRADAVRDALVGAGAPAGVLIARGYGGDNPIASNDTEDGRFRNRRLEFHALKVPAAAPAAPTATVPSTLAIDEGPGGVAVSGAVPDEHARAAILDALKRVFGADAIKGDVTVEADRLIAPWFVNLRAALDDMKLAGLKATFEGGAIKLGGAVSEADRRKIADALASLFGGGVTVGALVPSFADWTTAANAKATAALGGLKGGSGASDVVGALNLSVVNFATGSAEVPDSSLAFLRQAAAILKALPPGGAIEIAGYTDNTGAPDANLVLSRRRAESVRLVLISAGAPEGLLTANGYGAANPVESNDTEEGRFHNRRIEYHLIKSP